MTDLLTRRDMTHLALFWLQTGFKWAARKGVPGPHPQFRPIAAVSPYKKKVVSVTEPRFRLPKKGSRFYLVLMGSKFFYKNRLPCLTYPLDSM